MKPIAHAGGDQIIDLSGGGTIGDTIQKNFSGSQSLPGTDAISIASYKWYVVSAPDSWDGGLLNKETATVTLDKVNQWGTWRLFLVVTDNKGNSSETDPIKAPNSAFGHLYVKSTKLGLVKPATGQRNWQAWSNHQTAQLEQFKIDYLNRTVQQISDTNATGAQLNTLTAGPLSNADTLHTHTGTSIDTATTAALGVTKLAEAPLDAANPKALTQAHGFWTATVNHTLTASGMVGQIFKADGSQKSPFVASWPVVGSNIVIVGFGFSLMDGGPKATAAYKMKLYELSATEYKATTGLETAGSEVGETGSAVPDEDYGPSLANAGSLNHSCTSGKYLGALISQGILPSNGAAGSFGRGLTVWVEWRRKF